MYHRRSIRLKGYDYSLSGANFVTLVAWHRESIFGRIQAEEVVLSAIGRLIRDCWVRLPLSFNLNLDEWTIMPNHLHGIIVIHSKGEVSARNIDLHEEKLSADASPRPAFSQQSMKLLGLFIVFILFPDTLTSKLKEKINKR